MTEEKKVYWDANEPLKRVENGESAAASQALYDYAHMGYNRSLKGLAEKYQDEEDPPTKSYETIAYWSSTFEWQDRVAKWEEIERQREEKIWRARKDKIREKEWDNFDRLQEIISKILEDMPNFVKRKEKIIQKGKVRIYDSAKGRITEEGQTEIRAIVLSFDVNAAISFIKTASDIGRRATEMDRKASNLLNEIDFAKLSPEQVTRVAEGEHILDVLGVRK